MQQIALKDVAPGDFIRRKPDAKKTWQRGAYDRSSKRYELTDFDDISNALYLKGATLVWIDFEF